MTTEEATQLGRAVEKLLAKPGEWPRILVFEIYDHKRRVEISSLQKRLFWSCLDEGDMEEDDLAEFNPGGMINFEGY